MWNGGDGSCDTSQVRTGAGTGIGIAIAQWLAFSGTFMVLDTLHNKKPMDRNLTSFHTHE